ncbi:MAG: cation-transporting P-type ATPase [Candidatus Daviesbacteria bacterium]
MDHNFPGLTSEQALKKLQEFGSNEIKDLNKVSPLEILFRQTKKNYIIYLLLIGAIISFLIGEPITGYTIFSVILAVISISFFQEYRAEKAISALEEMISPVSLVRRNGKETEVASRELVPGDILILRNGEKVPADCLVLKEKDLLVNESIITGEVKELKKKAAHDEKNFQEESLLLMGSYLVGGKATALVIKTGMDTKFGSIAKMISQTEKELPLQDKVNNIAKYMVIAAISISILTGALMVIRSTPLSPTVISEILILVIALSVSAFPEGLPVVLVTTLAVGANRMAKKNAIVNRMSIIETLGETTVICVDKTGTITTGEMTVKKIFADGKIYEVAGAGFEAEGGVTFKGKAVEKEKDKIFDLLLKAVILCNDAAIERTGEDKEYKIMGTPTEGALLILGAKLDTFREDLDWDRLEEMPFSSERKLMSVLVAKNDESYVFAKGALEMILDRCQFVQSGNKIVALSLKQKEEIKDINKEFTKETFRTLALAYKHSFQRRLQLADKKGKSYQKNYTEDELVFLGLVGMEDPPREEVKEAIEECLRAGIKVKMITGDHRETALAVASEINLTGKILEGEDLDKLTDEELTKIISEVVVFARVRPEHKFRIVKILKQIGEVVTMTGDGVNDAPALKEAQIGVAMGKGGTDVARSVADLTLKDDNFITIVAAIREGRTIFNNIRKFISYQLSCNYTELAILFTGVFLAPFLGWQVPLLLALQILFMNLVTDDLPALTLAFNPTSTDVMREKPRVKTEILNKKIIIWTGANSLIMAILTLLSFYLTFNILHQSLEVARTTALVVLILLEIANAFNFRSFRKQILNRSPFVNPYLVYASMISLLTTMIILYTPANKIFKTSPIGFESWFTAIVLTLVFVLWADLAKELNKRRGVIVA